MDFNKALFNCPLLLQMQNFLNVTKMVVFLTIILKDYLTQLQQ